MEYMMTKEDLGRFTKKQLINECYEQALELETYKRALGDLVALKNGEVQFPSRKLLFGTLTKLGAKIKRYT